MLTLAADRFLAIASLLIGLSHVVQPEAWALFFRKLTDSGIAALSVAMYTLPTGLLIALAHRDWSWGPQWLFLFFGVSYSIKRTLYLLVPKIADISIRKHGLEPKSYRIAGIALLLISVPQLILAFGRDPYFL